MAAKRASPSSIQGQKQFQNEIVTLSRLHHRCLVKLEGFCQEAGEQVCLCSPEIIMLFPRYEDNTILNMHTYHKNQLKISKWGLLDWRSSCLSSHCTLVHMLINSTVHLAGSRVRVHEKWQFGWFDLGYVHIIPFSRTFFLKIYLYCSDYIFDKI